MKKFLFQIVFLFSLGTVQQAISQIPTTAYDFTMNDCKGKMHHLFSELDSGNVVVMEYIMLSCSPCIEAGHSLDAMVTPLKKKYGNKVRFYQFGFTKSYTCTQIQNWVNTNGFANTVPFDSGDVQVAYYGGMGMPTVAVVGGKDHQVLFSSIDFKKDTDTAVISKSIHDFFETTGISTNSSFTSSVLVYPNPAGDQLILLLHAARAGVLHLTVTNPEGQQIAVLPDENVGTGPCSKAIDTQLKNGSYLLNAEMNGERFTKKIIIINQ